MMMQAILDDDFNVVQLDWDEYVKRQVESGTLSTPIAKYNNGNYTVSTVFLGIASDHQWFETMVFCSTLQEDVQVRCSTYQDALELHYECVGRMKASPSDPLGCMYSKAQLMFLGERECDFDDLDKVDQFTFVMLA